MPRWLLVAAIVLGAVWGWLERRIALLRMGYYVPELGWERSNFYVRVSQGLIALAIMGLATVAVFLFGWKVGIGTLFIAMLVGAVTS